MNPLLDFSGLPRFDAIEPEHVAPAITELLAQNRGIGSRLADPATPATWQGFVAPLIDAEERLGRAWGIVSHLHSVKDVPPWREAYNAMLPEVTRFYAELGQNLGLFRKFKALHDGPDFMKLDHVRRRIIDNNLRDFRLSGAELPEDQKPRFQKIQEELAAAQSKFSENLLDATNAYSEIVTDDAALTGIPEADRLAAREAAARDDEKNAENDAEKRAAGKPKWKFTLRAPSYVPVMQFADNRELRGRMYRAYATRASELGPPQWDNGPLIVEILRLRAEQAHMLGYRNYAEVSLVPKMARSVEEVAAFLREIAAKARPFAEKDVAELTDYARSRLGLAELQSWDIAWASEKLRQERYAFSSDEVKQYFPEHKVLAGLFHVIGTLFGVTLVPDSAPAWHPDVRFFRVERMTGAGPELVGQFYVDLYAREEKRGGAWMDEAITRRALVVDGRGAIQAPVAYLNCNFSGPVGGKPACFTHDEVSTLFHECGHCLHHLLTEVDELPVSGIHGVEWDAVELPSQFMENFCWEWDVVSGLSEHVDTGAPLPRALFDRMLAAKNFQSGLATLRQIEFALFDLLLHSDFAPGGDVLELLNRVRREVAVLLPPDWQRFPHSFSHIFAGGYAAGYYSYKWAEVLSSDAYEAFEESAAASGTVLDHATGMRFWHEILSVGGARPMSESFRAFRGREPHIDALLRHNGMIAA